MSTHKNPCKPDCPRRSAFCRRECQEWIDYETEHRAELMDRQRLAKEHNTLESYLVDRSVKIKKKREH